MVCPRLGSPYILDLWLFLLMTQQKKASHLVTDWEIAPDHLNLSGNIKSPSSPRGFFRELRRPFLWTSNPTQPHFYAQDSLGEAKGQGFVPFFPLHLSTPQPGRKESWVLERGGKRWEGKALEGSDITL